MKWYFKALYQYFDFYGRARRKEFWFFMFINGLITWLLYKLKIHYDSENFTIALYVYGFLVLIPSIAVFVRRLHDSGKTGWNILLILIPFIGWLWLLILLILLGEPRTNKWGAYPKGIEENY